VDGVILLAHGSRDPLWRRPVEAVAERVRADAPQALVACAYIELCEPDLPTAVADLVDRGVKAVSIVPMFLGMGKHVREDLPGLAARLSQQHPGLRVTLRPTVGEEPRLIALLAELAAPNRI
jgi:sirohydrochlorin cobaltochelatase